VLLSNFAYFHKCFLASVSVLHAGSLIRMDFKVQLKPNMIVELQGCCPVAQQGQ
jgi:hypothetical protein